MKIIWVLVVAVFFAGILKTILKTNKAKKALKKGKDREADLNAVKRLNKNHENK